MSKNLQHMDQLFRDAIEPYEEKPSPDIWKSLQAKLDKEDADSYKRKYIKTRRFAILLLLILLSFAIYETGVKRYSTEKLAGQIIVNKDAENKQGNKIKDGSVPAEKLDHGAQSLIIRKKRPFATRVKVGSPGAPDKNGKEGKTIEDQNVFFNIKRVDDLMQRKPAELVPPVKPKLPYLFNSIAVRTNLQKVKQRRSFHPFWTVTATVSQEWAQYKMESTIEDNGSAPPDGKTEISHRERNELSFTARVLASYQFKKDWGIQAGLIYSNTSIAINPQTLYATQEADGVIAYKYNSSSGYGYVKPNFGLTPAVGDSISTTHAQHNIQYLSLPLFIKYKIGNKKISISPGFGFSANFITSAKIKTKVEDALDIESVTIKKLEGTNQFFIGLMTSADIQYDFSRKWSLNIVPGFRYSLTPITKNTVIKTFPYSFGVGTGISYKL